jgi:hypothetical protein
MAFAIGLLVASVASAQNLPRDCVTARAQREEARVKRDRATFERLTTADFVVVDQLGRIENQKERAERLARPGGGPGPVVAPRTEERTAIYNNDTIVLYWQENTANGIQNVTEIWVKDGGQWKVAAAHVSQPPVGAGRESGGGDDR